MRVTGGRRLKGEIEISGAKNATLPMLAATLLTADPCRVGNIPDLHDIETMKDILAFFGVKFERHGSDLLVQAQSLSGVEAPYDYVRKMRASVLLLGPLLARCGSARVALPGGCAIGVRPIDQHLKAFESMGAEIELKEGYVEAKAKRLKGVTHAFDTVTVTGTINAMMAAALADGTTELQNCAEEPEVTAVADALRQMGAEINGVGTAVIQIKGQKKLNGFHLPMIPDRIETGTYMAAAAITAGDLFLLGANPADLEAVISKLRESGATITVEKKGLRVKGSKAIYPAQIKTAPHPGFPTDMQAQLMALLSLADGTSTITETIFENRFMHVAELNRMGADLRISGSTVTVVGVKKLRGAPVMATDLRASASLVLAGLAAEGVTEILRIYHLDRGYERMDAKLASVGADIERIPT